MSLVISLLFGQVVSGQTSNITALVDQGIKDYNTGNFLNAIKSWQEALKQDKNNPSVTAVVNENLARALCWVPLKLYLPISKYSIEC